jgi:hypothetical protein
MYSNRVSLRLLCIATCRLGNKLKRPQVWEVRKIFGNFLVQLRTSKINNSIRGSGIFMATSNSNSGGQNPLRTDFSHAILVWPKFWTDFATFCTLFGLWSTSVKLKLYSTCLDMANTNL